MDSLGSFSATEVKCKIMAAMCHVILYVRNVIYRCSVALYLKLNRRRISIRCQDREVRTSLDKLLNEFLTKDLARFRSFAIL